MGEWFQSLFSYVELWLTPFSTSPVTHSDWSPEAQKLCTIIGMVLGLILLAAVWRRPARRKLCISAALAGALVFCLVLTGAAIWVVDIVPTQSEKVTIAESWLALNYVTGVLLAVTVMSVLAFLHEIPGLVKMLGSLGN